MRNGDYNLIRAEGRDYVIVVGNFKPLSTIPTSATKLSHQRGKGFRVSRASAGVYSIHFDNDFGELVYANVNAQTNAVDDIDAEVGTYTPPTASANATLVLRVVDDEDNTRVAADLTDNENNRLHFIAIFRNSSLTP